MSTQSDERTNKTGILDLVAEDSKARPIRMLARPHHPIETTPSRPRPQRAHRPRPVSYERGYATKLTRLMAEGYSVTAVAGKFGVDLDTIKRWRRLYPEFRRAIEFGEAARVAYLEDRLLNARSMKDVKLAMRTLEIAAPHEWDSRKAKPISSSETKDPKDTGLRLIIVPAKQPATHYVKQVAKEEG